MREAWEEFTKTVYTDSQPLFAEYVDLLSGLALRDTGSGFEKFDKDIYRLADDLLSKWASDESVDWGSVTIPAYLESLGHDTGTNCSFELSRVDTLGASPYGT
jgi:hypothetical protein